jgi:hypothetical protein
MQNGEVGDVKFVMFDPIGMMRAATIKAAAGLSIRFQVASKADAA